MLSDGQPVQEVRDLALSGNGRYVAFNGWIVVDGRAAYRLWVRDVLSGVTEVASVNACDQEEFGFAPALSGDGRRVAFSAELGCDGSSTHNVYVRDLDRRVTYRASATQFPTEAHGYSYGAAISGDGRWVAFASDAHNMTVETDRCVTASAGLGVTLKMSCWDIYVKDLERPDAMPVRVSLSSSGREANGPSWSPTVSADGRRIAFASLADNLVPDDTNRTSDVFVHDVGPVRPLLSPPLPGLG